MTFAQLYWWNYPHEWRSILQVSVSDKQNFTFFWKQTIYICVEYLLYYKTHWPVSLPNLIGRPAYHDCLFKLSFIFIIWRINIFCGVIFSLGGTLINFCLHDSLIYDQIRWHPKFHCPTPTGSILELDWVESFSMISE